MSVNDRITVEIEVEVGAVFTYEFGDSFDVTEGVRPDDWPTDPGKTTWTNVVGDYLQEPRRTLTFEGRFKAIRHAPGTYQTRPWTPADGAAYGVPKGDRVAWSVRMYRRELTHGGLLSDWGGIVSEARWEEMARLMDELPQDLDPSGYQGIRPLFRHLLRDASALACWCPTSAECHGDVLLELLA